MTCLHAYRAAGSILAAALLIPGCLEKTSNDPAPTTSSGSDAGSGSGSGSGSAAASQFTAVILAADRPTTTLLNGETITAHVDPNLVNTWGLVHGRAGFWMANNVTGVVSIKDHDGNPAGRISAIKVEVGITGLARSSSAQSFLVHGSNACAAAAIIAVSDSGRIWGINLDVDDGKPFMLADRSAEKAVFKGVAVIESPSAPAGAMLLAADLRNARVDVFDANMQLLDARSAGSKLAANAFQDSNMPAGFAPSNISVIDTHVFVTFVKQNADKDDPVEGAGLGVLDEFDLTGKLVRRIATTGGDLDIPWGMSRVAKDFANGLTADELLVGNFGNGRITAFDMGSGREIGQLMGMNGSPLVVDGLWGITFANVDLDATADPHALFFAAGPEDEMHGELGKILAMQHCGNVACPQH